MPAKRKKREKTKAKLTKKTQTKSSTISGKAEKKERAKTQVKKKAKVKQKEKIKAEKKQQPKVKNTEQKNLLEVLKKSRQHFQFIADTAPAMIAHLDKKRRYKFVNKRYAERHGILPQDIVGKFMWDIIGKRAYENIRHFVDQTLAGKSVEFEMDIPYRDLGKRWVHASYTPEFDKNKNVLGFVAVIIDITERKQIDMDIERYASFPYLNPNPVLETDSSGNITFYNAATVRILKKLGVEDEVSRFLPKDLNVLFGQAAAAEEERGHYWEVRIKDAVFGEYVYFIDQFKSARIYAVDITEQRSIEKKLQERQEDLNRAQAVALTGSWRLDVVRNELTWSDENHRIFGIPKGITMTYETFLNTVHPDDRQYVDTKWKAGLRGEHYDIEHRIIVDGKIKWVRERAELEFDNEGNLRSGFGTTQDITERKILEEELDKYTEHLETIVEERTRELSKAYREFEAFFDYSITPLVFLDREFNFIRVNKAYAISCNRDIPEFSGRNHFEFYPSKENEAIFRRVVETKIPYLAIARPFSLPDQPERGVTYWDWILTPVLDAFGEVDFLVFSLRDVTQRKEAEDALFLSERKYRSLVEQAADGIAILDKWLNIIEVNPAICEMSGYSKEELSGVNIKNLIPSEDLIAKPLPLDRLFAGEIVREERRVIRKDGSLMDMEASAKLLDDGNIHVITHDVTERKERESRNRLITGLLELFTKKQSRKEYLDSVVQLIHLWSGCQCVGIRILDEQGYIPYESYVGFSREFIEYENKISLDKDICAFARVFSGQHETQDIPVLTPKGSVLINNSLEFERGLTQYELSQFRGYCIQKGFLSIGLIPIRYHDRTIGLLHLTDGREGMLTRMVIEFLETVTAMIGEAILRFNTEEELRKSREELRALFAHVQFVREQERTQIARQIHDDFGAILTGLKVDISSLEKNMPSDREQVKMRLKDDLELIDSAVQTVRRISSELRPSVLDHLGLTAAIEWQIKEFGNRAGIPWEISIDVRDRFLDREMSTAVFRIFQEALMNVIRHAEATKIEVDLKESNGVLVLDVVDNGIGIPEEKLIDHHSFGLMGMKERVQYLGGKIEIKGIIGKGTTVSVMIPLKHKEHVND